MQSVFLAASDLRRPTSPPTVPGFHDLRREPERPGLAATVRRWLQRLRERRELGTLTPRDFRDMGVSSSEVRAEMAKPFWRP
jgi:uncharacterized protein YjiS (DUF1127 family)